jgi:glycosyltransferase involved in cell wall biosynthesis
LNISENSLVFLYAGKFEEVKDPPIIPKAFIKAQLKGDVHLVMVGNGILEKPLKEEYGDFFNIHFLDFQNQTMMPSIYEMADVYILSSKSETWGLAVNEAMANGKAIIVSDKCGCAVDLVKNGKNGYIFRSGNIEDLQNKLGLVSGNRDKLAEMKKYSKFIIQDFSLTLVAEIVEKQVRKF